MGDMRPMSRYRDRPRTVAFYARGNAAAERRESNNEARRMPVFCRYSRGVRAGLSSARGTQERDWGRHLDAAASPG